MSQMMRLSDASLRDQVMFLLLPSHRRPTLPADQCEHGVPRFFHLEKEGPECNLCEEPNTNYPFNIRFLSKLTASEQFDWSRLSAYIIGVPRPFSLHSFTFCWSKMGVPEAIYHKPHVVPFVKAFVVQDATHFRFADLPLSSATRKPSPCSVCATSGTFTGPTNSSQSRVCTFRSMYQIAGAISSSGVKAWRILNAQGTKIFDAQSKGEFQNLKLYLRWLSKAWWISPTIPTKN
ncbi:hypothetical protein R3P38DRAFT_3235276 [Favolaschia claudopus]|uniref:Uncharacterized protein n=1 Tax=Favolaschia claudopus TaxID=2862362 RepID=A0AAV9ZF09_9AGAR